MQNYLVTTCEILLTIVIPLLVLYLKGNWPMRKVIPALVILPLIWYFTYAPIHELSHAVGTYLVGGKVIDYRLIPRFWLGEFAGAWATPGGYTQSWQQLISSAFPYILDIVSLVVAIFVFRRGFSRNPFYVGLAFMLLSLRPAFDFVSETIGFLSGSRGDLYFIQRIAGPFALWSLILIAIVLSVYSISSSLSRLVRSSKHDIGQNPNDIKHNFVQARR
ncbi:hypothetical protein EG832_04715 [bacterium]|nr:hypothetical protein [bacterium]